MKSYGLALSLGTLLALGSSLQASTVYNYTFGGLGSLGSSTHTFAPVSGPNPAITATGYQELGATLSSVNLYSKSSSTPDENGLGLTNDGDHEIKYGSFIMLDLFNLDSLGMTSLSLDIESSTGSEKWEIWGSNTLPSSHYSLPGSGVLMGTTEHSQNISSLEADRYIFVSAKTGNVLLGGLSATVTPEPASAGLVGLALAGVGLLFRRRFSK